MISRRVLSSFQSCVFGNVLVLRLEGGEPFAQRLQLAFEFPAGVVGRVQLALERIEFLEAGRCGVRFQLGDEGVVEGLAVEILRAFPQIRAPRPVEDVRQLPHHVQRVFRCGRLVAVDRHVAGLPDVLGLLPHDLRDERAEGGLAEVGVQVGDLRRAQGLFDPVDAFNQALQRVACVEAGGPWVAVDVVLGVARALRGVRELLIQEREVGRDFHGGLEVSAEGARL